MNAAHLEVARRRVRPRSRRRAQEVAIVNVTEALYSSLKSRNRIGEMMTCQDAGHLSDDNPVTRTGCRVFDAHRRAV